MIDEPIYILTAKLDPDSFVWLDTLRRAHFPPSRNILAAHLTMFHRLAEAQIARLDLVRLPDQPIEVTFDRVVFMGFGSSIHVASDELRQLRHDAKVTIGGDLSRQDSQAWSPHVTIQNKVEPVAAKHTFQTLEQEFVPRIGATTGLEVWEYLGGPWRPVRNLPFGAASMEG